MCTCNELQANILANVKTGETIKNQHMITILVYSYVRHLTK